MASCILTVDETMQLNIVIENTIKMESKETISLLVVPPIVSFLQGLLCWAPPPGQEMPLSLRMLIACLLLLSHYAAFFAFTNGRANSTNDWTVIHTAL